MILRTIALTTALLASAGSAHALEGKELLDQFTAQLQDKGRSLTWGTLLEESSDSFVLTDVEIKTPAGKITKIKGVSVRGLKETSGRITYDSIAIANVNGKSDDGGDVGITGIASTQGNIPSGIWKDGLTAEEKKQRIKFGNFTINGISIVNKEVNLAIGAVVLVNADIPLDYRYDFTNLDASAGDPAAPLSFDQFAITKIVGSQQDVKFQLDSFTIANASIPTTINATIMDWMKLYSSFSLNGIAASKADQSVFALGTMAGTITPASGDGTITSATTMTGLDVNLLAIPDPQAKAVAQQLGYDKIQGSMTGIGSYNPNTGKAEIRDTVVKLKDMFDMSMNYTVTGYTPEIAQKFSKAQLEIASGKGPMQVYGAILGELGGVKLETLKIGLTDQSLTGKLLDFQAKQMGTTGDQLAAGAPMMIGLGMGGLQMPALTEMVTAAVGTFLKEKGSIVVEATPVEPVPILNVVMAGQSDPKQIPKMLNLKIEAQ